MVVKCIVHIFTAAKDRNGNCYHAVVLTNTRTGERLSIREIDSDNNPRMYLANVLPFEAVYYVQETFPIRQWNALVKGFGPYVASERETITEFGRRCAADA